MSQEDMQWEFEKYGPGSTLQDSSSDKFFKEAPGAESLVREFVQNSLDAAVDSKGEKPVRIVIKEVHLVSKDSIEQLRQNWPKEKPLSKDVVAPYLSGLRKHLHACGIKAEGSNIRFVLERNTRAFCTIREESEIKLVVLEDFNTKGLEGDNLIGFFLRDNITSKDHGGGSHGIGKAIFSASSEINTFFWIFDIRQ